MNEILGLTFGLPLGLLVYLVMRVGVRGLYTVRPDERAVVTSFGRAQRLGGEREAAPDLSEDERQRYDYPAVRVVPPGGPYLLMPWQEVHKVSIATQSVDIVWDPTKEQDTIEAVTKDNLTTGVNGQLRYRVSENNLYPFLFGVQSPLEHIMGFFVSVLRERIANFVDPRGQSLIDAGELADETGSAVGMSEGVSINDLRKNLPLINQYMEEQCRPTPAVIAAMKPNPRLLDGGRRMNNAATFGGSSLGRRTEELVATAVSALNDCFY